MVLGRRARELGISCHTCHPNGATNATFRLAGISDRPGNVDLASSFFRAGADDGLDLPVNIPSLRGARFTAPYGHDGRTASLAEFAAGVVSGEFDGALLAPRRLAALVRYVDDLDFLPNPLLREDGRLAAGAPNRARRGEALFAKPLPEMGGRACATCHAPSTFFRDGKVHRIGSAKKPSAAAMTDGLETPTLLGLEETAPYFHDGSLATLRDVVDWFCAHYTLPWSPDDRADVTAYLDAVGHVEARFDARPPAREKAEALAYSLLLREGEAMDNPWVWDLVLDRAASELSTMSPTPATAARIEAARREIDDLVAERARGTAPKELRGRAAPLHERLVRLAADWAGSR